MIALVSDLRTLLLGSDGNKLDEWITKAEGMQIPELDRFLKLIRLDKEIVLIQLT